jgi:hypothetical protein
MAPVQMVLDSRGLLCEYPRGHIAPAVSTVGAGRYTQSTAGLPMSPSEGVVLALRRQSLTKVCILSRH